MGASDTFCALLLGYIIEEEGEEDLLYASVKALNGSTRTVTILGMRLIEEEHRGTLAIIMN